MADHQAIAKQFTEYYYQKFDGERSGLAVLYRDNSMMTWESTPILGVGNIMDKLTTLPFAKVQHKVLTLDAQPSAATPDASILVLVTGQLIVDDGTNILQYSQMFHLVQEGPSFFVQNDVFRLVYG